MEIAEALSEIEETGGSTQNSEECLQPDCNQSDCSQDSSYGFKTSMIKQLTDKLKKEQRLELLEKLPTPKVEKKRDIKLDYKLSRSAFSSK